MSAALAPSISTADYINPMLRAARMVFETMLGCTPRRTGLTLKDSAVPRHEISACIGITGRAVGTVVLSLSNGSAREILYRLVGEMAAETTPEVLDAVGELTNMIAGNAKAELAELELAISLPHVIIGRGHKVHYPSNVQPICISFETELGAFTLEVALVDRAEVY